MAWHGAVRARKGFAITPDDNNDLPEVIEAIYVGGTGNIEIICEQDSSSVTLLAVPVGLSVQGIRIKRVRAAGTAATNLIGFY